MAHKAQDPLSNPNHQQLNLIPLKFLFLHDAREPGLSHISRSPHETISGLFGPHNITEVIVVIIS